ncbi:ketopantoate reductase family protein [Cyclobacterium qasimii]|uniref:2-dehydropantoate 2-reductase n=2 Tax=Cyclobacterium qasimii TaxID=1350429 RepID=S7WEX3_9BACT|nr:2-dehydropantoate 2-reductase [Cyclobacterium qasimii]EPR65304.1 2-dehydropantoate 2-reductase [Cyclobacterium qasimii M12-11B]GEO21896.1 putative oxidoreductase YkpB [Cyclobacterium qasimii]
MKIGILGMGGIGSFIGAKLTKNFEKDEETKVIFICRNKTKEVINKDGLSLITGDEIIKSKPYLASDNPDEIGLLDILIVATKSFSLAAAIGKYQDCLKEETIIIPLQNGVNAKESIEKNIEHDPSKILEGCIYIASNIEKPGVVKHLGGPGKIFFGNNDDSDFEWVEKVLVNGGLDATYTKDIKEILWKKYLFVSPLAVMTTALDITFGALAEEPKYMAKLEKMMREVQALAGKFNVTLTEQNIADSLAMLSNFPYKSKSSLQLDFENQNSQTEKEDFLDFVIKNGKKFEVKVANYEEMNQKIEVLLKA